VSINLKAMGFFIMVGGYSLFSPDIRVAHCDMPAGLAAVVNLERFAVRLVLYDNTTAAIAECFG
jgi:hypothetical protein